MVALMRKKESQASSWLWRMLRKGGVAEYASVKDLIDAAKK